MTGPGWIRIVLRSAALVLFNVIIGVALLEGIFLTLLHSPGLTARSPKPVQRLVQQIYRHFNRMLVQFDPACAVYDPEVTYTLKPGACTFRNIEFETRIEVNGRGVRDREAALDHPDVIVVGDSHAMGWGVEQNEAFPKVLAQRTGLNVLNAAVSSYGTAREMLLLNRFDTSHLQVLVIQYADNDLPENRSFREHEGRLPITPESDYQQIVRYYASQQAYYPGKYVFRLVMKLLRLEEPEPDQLRMDPITPMDEAELFVYVVTHGARVPLNEVQLVVLEVNQDIGPRRPFMAALDQFKRNEANPPYIQRLITLDTAVLLSPEDFFVLDDHMKPSGHQAIGEALANAITSSLRKQG